MDANVCWCWNCMASRSSFSRCSSTHCQSSSTTRLASATALASTSSHYLCSLASFFSCLLCSSMKKKNRSRFVGAHSFGFADTSSYRILSCSCLFCSTIILMSSSFCRGGVFSWVVFCWKATSWVAPPSCKLSSPNMMDGWVVFPNLNFTIHKVFSHSRFATSNKFWYHCSIRWSRIV